MSTPRGIRTVAAHVRAAKGTNQRAVGGVQRQERLERRVAAL
jgi:hypothetical protein